MSDIKVVLHDVLNEQSTPLTQVMDRHFSVDYRQRTDGAWEDRAGVTEHFAHLRSMVEAASIEVVDELVDGTRYADRHIATIRKRDGSQVVQEVYLFGERDTEGRFTRVEETTLMLSGSEADRRLGSAKSGV